MVDGVQKLRTLEYSIPEVLEKHIDLISPTTFFGRTKVHAAIPPPEQLDSSSRNCHRYIEPKCVAQMYNFSEFRYWNPKKLHIGFTSFLNQSAQIEDLIQFQTHFGLPLKSLKTVIINGGNNHQNPRGKNSEANLDSQWISAVTQNLEVTQFITGGKP